MKLSVLVSDPIKEEKTHKTKSIQNLVLNAMVALSFMCKTSTLLRSLKDSSLYRMLVTIKKKFSKIKDCL